MELPDECHRWLHLGGQRQVEDRFRILLDMRNLQKGVGKENHILSWRMRSIKKKVERVLTSF